MEANTPSTTQVKPRGPHLGEDFLNMAASKLRLIQSRRNSRDVPQPKSRYFFEEYKTAKEFRIVMYQKHPSLI